MTVRFVGYLRRCVRPGFIVAMGVLLAGCLNVNGHPHLVRTYMLDGPDPAAVLTTTRSQGVGRVFTTAELPGAVAGHIPTWGWSFNDNTPVGGATDALPNLPSWEQLDDGCTWAPSVRGIGSSYTLVWAGTKSGTACGQHCIGMARSTAPQGPYTLIGIGDFVNGWCPAPSAGPNVSFLDPQIFNGPNGTHWLLFSRQDYSQGATGDLDIVQLSADGTQRVGTVHTLETYADVIAAGIAPSGYVPGPNPRLENPAMIPDPANGVSGSNGYDLLASLGSFQGSRVGATYTTMEIPCDSITGGCHTSSGYELPLKGDSPVTDSGGASLLFDTDINGNHIVFAGHTQNGGDSRFPYVDGTFCSTNSGGTC